MSAYIPAKHSWSMGGVRVRRLSLYIALSVVVLTSLAVALVQMALLAMSGMRGEDLVQLPTSASTTVTAEGTTAKRDHGYVIVQGEAVNRGSRPARNLEAVVELFDGSGILRGVESAMVNMPCVPQNEESAFAVRLPDPGQAASYRVRFRSLGDVTP